MYNVFNRNQIHGARLHGFLNKYSKVAIVKKGMYNEITSPTS